MPSNDFKFGPEMKKETPVVKEKGSLSKKKRKRKKVDINFEKARRYFNIEISRVTKVFNFIVEGKPFPCLCKDGVVYAKNKKLCECLEGNGFRFMGEIEDEDFDEYEYEDYLEED